jgi:hypothetical protein
MRNILRVGGRSIPGELAPRGPALLSSRDFFLLPQIFDGRHSIEMRMLAAGGRKAAAVSDT